MNDYRNMDVCCATCGHVRSVSLGQMVEHLRGLGMFKRQKEPDPQLVCELYASQIPLLRCGECGRIGFDAHAEEELDDAQWGGLRACEVCGQAIVAERLEVFPDTRRCTGCQGVADRGEDAVDTEYCPRCGAIMEMRLRGGAGITGYAMRCRECGFGA